MRLNIDKMLPDNGRTDAMSSNLLKATKVMQEQRLAAISVVSLLNHIVAARLNLQGEARSSDICSLSSEPRPLNLANK